MLEAAISARSSELWAGDGRYFPVGGLGKILVTATAGNVLFG